MTDPDEEDDTPNDKNSLSRSGDGVGDGDADGDPETREDLEELEEDSDDFFDAGEHAVVGYRFSRAASSSGGGTEDDAVGPITPSAATATSTIPPKPTAVAFSRTISSDSADDDEDEEWVDPTPIPATPLETALPVFPPPIAKTKSSSSAKSAKYRKCKEANVPFPSSVVEGEDRPPRRIPQMSTARGRDGGRTQSGGVKGVISPEPEPEMEPELDVHGPAEVDPDGDDF